MAVATPDMLDTPTVPPIAMGNSLERCQALSVVSAFLTAFFTEHVFHNVTKMAELEETGTYCQIYACSENRDQQRQSPEPVGQIFK